MKQIYTFTERPATITNGGFLKAHHIVWLNLCVKEIAGLQDNSIEYQSETERLVLDDHNIESFAQAVDNSLISAADNREIEAILQWFGKEDDIEAWALIRKVQVKGFDSSDTVNSILLNGHNVWFDKTTRLGLVNMYRMMDGSERVPSIWHGGVEFPMPSSERAMEILREVEMYAMQCYDATQRTLNDIDFLLADSDLEGIKSFDIAERYPERLDIKV